MAGGGSHPPFGLIDLPQQQRQQPAAVDFGTSTHLARAHSAADAHRYGIDCGNGALPPLAELPHCGAVVTLTQTDLVALYGAVSRCPRT